VIRLRSETVNLILRALRKADFLVRSVRRRLLPPQFVLFEDVTGSWLSSALGAIVEIQLPERVPEGGISLEVLSEETGLDQTSLLRLLRVVVSHGYFRLSEDASRVVHTSLSRALISGMGGSFCRLQASSWYRSCFSSDQVAQAMRGDNVPFLQAQGESFFEHLGRESPKDELFAQAMAEITKFCFPFLANKLHFSQGHRVLDVGGGNGEFCKLLSSVFPQTSFSVMDITNHEPQVEVESSRVNRLHGCFLDNVPSGFDHLVLKNVLHDWNEEMAVRILKNCALAVKSGGRMTIIEVVLPQTTNPRLEAGPDLAIDWNVFCTLGGQERSLQEYSDLLGRTGWRLVASRETATPLCVIEAVI
jgi:hypothetical protein